MKHTKILALVLCLCMVATMFVSCGDTTGTESGTTSVPGATGDPDNDKYLDEKGEITNIGSSTTMKITPEEIGELKNPVVKGLETWMTDSRLATTVALREEAYGIDYQYDTCQMSERMAKWVSAYVAGDAYDVLWVMAAEFPIVAQKGLVQPLEKILPVHDEKYFNQATTNAFSWKGRVYGANDALTGVDTFGIYYNATLFDNAGETSPLELYESGQWTWDALLNLAKTFYNVSGAPDDVYGFAGSYDFIARSAIVSNGGAVITYTDTGADITLKDKKTMGAIDWSNQLREYNVESRPTFLAGGAAMYIERISQMNTIRAASSTYEFGWVPFPKGPLGTGEQAGNVDAWAIGKGAKNIAGALAWISAGNYYETWAEDKDFSEFNTLTEEEKARADAASALGRMDNYKGFEISVYGLLEDSKSFGTATAVEKYTSQFQAKIDKMLDIKSEVGGVDFENQGVISFDTPENYPFVNVIGDDKVSYGTADNPSLKIDLNGMTEFATILHTKPEMYKLQKGGQYKVTFKFYCEVDPGKETFALVAREKDNLTGDPSFGLTWIEPKAGEAVEVEAYINVNANFDGDLVLALLGSATEDNPDLSVLIDDFNVELVAG